MNDIELGSIQQGGVRGIKLKIFPVVAIGDNDKLVRVFQEATEKIDHPTIDGTNHETTLLVIEQFCNETIPTFELENDDDKRLFFRKILRENATIDCSDGVKP